MTDITVRAHTRKRPAKKPDPLDGMIQARREILEKRWAPALAQAKVNQYRESIGFISWFRRWLGRK